MRSTACPLAGSSPSASPPVLRGWAQGLQLDTALRPCFTLCRSHGPGMAVLLGHHPAFRSYPPSPSCPKALVTTGGCEQSLSSFCLATLR